MKLKFKSKFHKVFYASKVLVVRKPILVFSFGFDQAEQKSPWLGLSERYTAQILLGFTSEYFLLEDNLKPLQKGR